LLGVKGCSEILEAIPANIEKAVIGGINEKNLHEAISLKCGICISQAICASPSPYESIRRILEIIDCA
jgi:thiamine monophosphate synthase